MTIFSGHRVMQNEVACLLQLMQTKGVGPRSLARILDRLAEDRLSLQDFMGWESEDLAVRFGLTDDQVRSIHANEQTAERTAELLEDRSVRLLLRTASAYPDQLKAVLGNQSPPVLFVVGSPDLLKRRGVGFCGARDASEQALLCADQVARALVEHELLVVSGHAAGVDEAAHRGALDAGGQTALVLPEGILRFRPRPSIAGLITEDNSVAVSEFSPNLPWSVHNAMQRNRTICGLVKALIVIEAGTSGGTWEAGLEAIRLGIPLFVLDYQRPAPSGMGNPLLLKKGGQPLPCQPGEPPDLTLLVRALELTPPRTRSVQPNLFDHLGQEAAGPVIQD